MGVSPMYFPAEKNDRDAHATGFFCEVLLHFRPAFSAEQGTGLKRFSTLDAKPFDERRDV